MNTELAQELITALKSGSSLKASEFLLLAVMAAVFSFIGAYLASKAKNLATKEDVGRIIEIEERIRSDFREKFETLSARNRLREAAIEKRLEAHQKAFSLWMQLMHNINDSEKLITVVLECQRWWPENCLYLTSDASAAFVRAYRGASLRRTLLDHAFAIQGPRPEELLKQITENYYQIEKAGEVITKAADLPSFSVADLDVKGKPIPERAA